jgi:hypothetical protein
LLTTEATAKTTEALLLLTTEATAKTTEALLLLTTEAALLIAKITCRNHITYLY